MAFTYSMFILPGDMLDEVTAIVEGYNAYFSFSKIKTGYSGEIRILDQCVCCIMDTVAKKIPMEFNPVTHQAHQDAPS